MSKPHPLRVAVAGRGTLPSLMLLASGPVLHNVKHSIHYRLAELVGMSACFIDLQAFAHTVDPRR